MTPFSAEQVRTVPANEASREDLAEIFSVRDASRCQCQRFKVLGWIWHDTDEVQRAARLQAQTRCGRPDAEDTSGLVAYVDDEPAGWVAVEPRIAYPKLRTLRVPWTGRPDEDRDDPGVWSVTCFVVRKGYRGRGLTYHLARAAVDHARERGAQALEGYSMITHAGKEITWGELHVGARQVFEEAGFRPVGKPTIRRVIMRIDFA
jgi:GNAT superfamily N-acetyltransferase